MKKSCTGYVRMNRFIICFDAELNIQVKKKDLKTLFQSLFEGEIDHFLKI